MFKLVILWKGLSCLRSALVLRTRPSCSAKMDSLVQAQVQHPYPTLPPAARQDQVQGAVGGVAPQSNTRLTQLVNPAYNGNERVTLTPKRRKLVLASGEVTSENSGDTIVSDGRPTSNGTAGTWAAAVRENSGDNRD